MMQFLRKNTRSIMLVVVVLFVVSCFAGYGMYFSSGRSGGDSGRDYAVAKINGKKIMRSKLETDVANLLQSMGMAQNISSEDYPALRKGVLEQMAIVSEMEKEIKNRNIKVSAASIDETLQNIEASFPTREIFMQQIQQAGLDEKKLKSNIEEQLRQNMLFESLMAGISVDQAEVRSYYDTMAAVSSPNLQKPAGYSINLAHFETEEKAQKAYDAIAAGNPAEKWNEVLAAASGDVLQFDNYATPTFVPTMQLVDKVAYLKDTAIGVVTKPVEIADKDFILSLKQSEQKAGVFSYDEVSADIEMMLRSQKGQSEQSKFIQELRGRANIEILDEDLFKVPEPETAAPEEPIDDESGDDSAATDEGETAQEEAVSADQ